ncbi:DUF4330 family protein [Halobaculum gomorrense]|uniref:DUF4330 domain-containing protein n=1 Tax=Halobaculum gomorrense TaxID=43928 RepID=A0A1M5UYV1_9EURY|nr:DUF4330 family protein [Halobaculum gomorrense]SHH68171.1 protein of unknown function [Halobaculum gomorrense]
MTLIDDEGNLFGVVNVVDALVILLVLAVVAAGAAFVLQPEPEPEAPNTATRNATLDLGTVPQYVVDVINEGDTYSPASNQQITITDVHLTPQGTKTRAILRVQIQGVRSGGSFSYDGAPARLGRTLQIATELYQVKGQIRAVGAGTALDTAGTPVVIRDTIPTQDARELSAGDEIRLSGRTVATIETVRAYPTEDSGKQLVFLTANLSAHRQSGTLRFGGESLRRGQTVTLPGESYTVDGRVLAVGRGLESGQADVLISQTVPTAVAQQITEGDTTTVGTRDVATVEHVASYGTSNPDRKRVFVGLSLTTVTTGTDRQFGTTELRRGSTLTFATDAYSLTGNIERVGATTQRGALADRTVTLSIREVREPMAQAIDAGMRERSGGETIAHIDRVKVEPSTIILKGDRGDLGVYDHPTLRDVTITATLQVRETVSGVRFKGRTIQQGSTVVLDLGTITIRATVISIR